MKIVGGKDASSSNMMPGHILPKVNKYFIILETENSF